MEACYKGGRAWFEGNIFQYMKEGSTEYTQRVTRAYRFNHTREVVDLVNKYLFRGDIVRNEEDAPDGVIEFWKTATLQGLSIDEFMRIASMKSSIGGCPWIVIDNQVVEVTDTTSQKDVGTGTVYAYVVSPLDVLDMSYDEQGILNWILIREHYRADEDPFAEDDGVKERFRLWTRDDWVLVTLNAKNEAEIEDMGSHGLGEVPAIRVDNTISDDPWTSPALIADIAYLDRAAANYASNLDAIIQDQTFSQLAMPAQNVLPGDDAYEAILQMGTKRIFLYDGESGVRPEYLSPDPRQAQLIISAIGQIINEIYHSVGLAGERTKEDNSKGIDNSSGVAKAFDFERVTALLVAKADSLETVENKIARLVAKWNGEKVEDDLVTYSETFDVRGLRDEIDIAMQLGLIDVPEILRSEQVKALSEKLLPGIGEDLKKRIEQEIEQWAKDLKEKSEPSLAAQSQEGKTMLEEAARNRSAAGDKQSDTKSRETGNS